MQLHQQLLQSLFHKILSNKEYKITKDILSNNGILERFDFFRLKIGDCFSLVVSFETNSDFNKELLNLEWLYDIQLKGRKCLTSAFDKSINLYPVLRN